MSQPYFDLSKVRFVKRLTVGNTSPTSAAPEEEIDAALQLLNRCLNDTPRGVIMGMEKNFGLFTLGEHQVVLQWMVYHLGFPRKPAWLEG